MDAANKDFKVDSGDILAFLLIEARKRTACTLDRQANAEDLDVPL